jgi:hypothetical protein
MQLTTDAAADRPTGAGSGFRHSGISARSGAGGLDHGADAVYAGCAGRAGKVKILRQSRRLVYVNRSKRVKYAPAKGWRRSKTGSVVQFACPLLPDA